ncbi:unnamed protein product [Rhizophagus irregularis]|nr:unnamed protein product [Rhizophagus irregularis]CAB4434715.1 unnamed protein product [Rhizophagus irregularis]
MSQYLPPHLKYIYVINSLILFSFTNLDEDINLGLILNKTTEYLQDLLRPFDEPVGCDNINSYLYTPLRKKLPAHYFHCCNFPDFFDYEGSEYLPDVVTAVGSAMELFEEKENQEMETSYMIDSIIHKMVQLAVNILVNLWARNNKVSYFTTTTTNKPVESSKIPIREEIGDVLSLGTEVKLNNLVALQYTINIIRIIRTFDHYGVIQTP